MNILKSYRMPTAGLKQCFKLLILIAICDFAVEFAHFHEDLLNQLPEILMEVSARTFLSSISILFLITLPERKKREKEILDSTHLMTQEIMAADQVMIISSCDLKGNVIYANDNFCKISGYSSQELSLANYKIISSNYHPKEFFNEMWQTISSGNNWKGQIRNKKKNGEYFWVDVRIVPLRNTNGEIEKFVSFQNDITAEKYSEELLEQEKIKNIHMARLSAIGELAAGLAHEVNNPLTVVSGLLTSINRKLKQSDLELKDPKIFENITKAQNQVIRISKIIKGLRELSHSGEFQDFQITSIQTIFDSISDLYAERLKNLGIRYEVKTDISELQCKLVQIEQVLINLINNSIDAIAHLDDKWIKIEVLAKGQFVDISVTDSGSGLNEEFAQKIMQPFFTTKEIGKGSGLGLSISRGIIEQHGGTLGSDLTAKNTRFIIQLPINESALFNLINIDEAVNNHLNWKQKIQTATSPMEAKDAINALLQNTIIIENWIQKIEKRFKTYVSFIDFKIAHNKFNSYLHNMLQENGHIQIKPGDEFCNLSLKYISTLREFRQISTHAISEKSKSA